MPESGPALRDIQGAFEAAAFVADFFLQLQDRIQQGFGPGWASGHINIHRNHLIDALNDGVVVEDSTGGRARAHRDYPFRFGHLVVELFDHGRHFLRHAAGDDHQIRLARRRTKYLRAETRDVEAGRGHRHHSIAQQAKPNPSGQIELLRAQFTALSSCVKIIPSSCSSLPKSSGFSSVTFFAMDVLIQCQSPGLFSHSLARRAHFWLRAPRGGLSELRVQSFSALPWTAKYSCAATISRAICPRNSSAPENFRSSRSRE